MQDATLFEAIGGADGVIRLARAWHQRVMADEIVHTLSVMASIRHTERLAPTGVRHGRTTTYSQRYGSESSVVRIHSGNGPHEEMDRRAIECFDAHWRMWNSRPRTARVLHEYFAWATTSSMASYPKARTKCQMTYAFLTGLGRPATVTAGTAASPPGPQAQPLGGPSASKDPLIYPASGGQKRPRMRA